MSGERGIYCEDNREGGNVGGFGIAVGEISKPSLKYCIDFFKSYVPIPVENTVVASEDCRWKPEHSVQR